MVYIILGKGFEEIEAITPCDILRRGGVDVQFAGIDGKTITGGHGIRVEADVTVEQMQDIEMLVLPGGLGGVASIRSSETAMNAIKTVWKGGKFVCAICAAPTILAQLGITDGKQATCYPGMENEMGSAHMTGLGAVTDGTVICGQAAGTAMDFGFELLKALKGADTAEQVRESMVAG